MNLADNKDRVPVPKWKALAQTPPIELVSAKNFSAESDLLQMRKDRAIALYYRWRETPTLDNALELLESTVFIDGDGLFYGPAKQVANSPESTVTSKSVAQRTLGARTKELAGPRKLITKQEVWNEIAKNKSRLRDEFRNGLLHAEQARLYTMIGEHEAAEAAFENALRIYPDNRHILRTYSRFMVHVDTPEIALSRLSRCAGLSDDPWLQAAEISLSELTGRGSKIAHSATRNIELGHIKPDHISELASALASLEFNTGHRKRFKKRFRDSLYAPTDNSLAQVMWFVRKTPDEVANITLQDPFFIAALRRSNEAWTYGRLKQKNWRAAVDSFLQWQSEESFSSHIAIQGSYYAISLAKDYKRGADICYIGLKANPRSSMLLNNPAVARRLLDDIEGAKSSLEEMKRFNPTWSNEPTFLVTDAMIKYAFGEIEAARRRYIDALSTASAEGNDALIAKIKMHWIDEEAKAGLLSYEEFADLESKISKSIHDRLDDEIEDYWEAIKMDAVPKGESGNRYDSLRRDILDFF